MINRISSYRGSSDRFKGKKPPKTPPVSPSQSPNVTPTITPTPDITPSITPTNTITPTLTISPTNTVTPTPSSTVTKTPTNTPTNTITPTLTISPTNTVTPTPSITPPSAPVASDINLEIWYDFSDATTITASSNPPVSGDTINSVNDKSIGTVKPANSTGGKRPKYHTNVYNNLSAAYFDGDNDLFTVNPITNFQSITGNTMILVGKFNNSSATNTMVQLGNGGNQRNANWFSIRSNSYQIGMGQGLATISGVSVDTNFHIFSAIYDGTLSGNDNRLKFRIDGVQRTLNFTQNVSGVTSSDTTVFYIGETANSIEDLDGYVGEVILYTKTLTESEVTNVENFLKNKWNIT